MIVELEHRGRWELLRHNLYTSPSSPLILPSCEFIYVLINKIIHIKLMKEIVTTFIEYLQIIIYFTLLTYYL